MHVVEGARHQLRAEIGGVVQLVRADRHPTPESSDFVVLFAVLLHAPFKHSFLLLELHRDRDQVGRRKLPELVRRVFRKDPVLHPSAPHDVVGDVNRAAGLSHQHRAQVGVGHEGEDIFEFFLSPLENKFGMAEVSTRGGGGKAVEPPGKNSCRFSERGIQHILYQA